MGVSIPVVVVLHAVVWLMTLFHSSCLVAALSDSERLQDLSVTAKSSNGFLISASISKFRSYVEVVPRSYSLVVMFSADQSFCQPCGQMREQLRLVSKEYNSVPNRKSGKQPTFFAEVKLSASDQSFLATYGIRHVPILYHFPSGKSKQFPKVLGDKSSDYFNLQQLGFSANLMKQFVNERTGSQMRVVRGGYEISFVQTVRQLMPYIFALLGIGVGIVLYTGVYKSPMLWFAVVVVVYIFSVGGGHYSWIHNTPLAVVDKNGRMQYIASGSRSQYVAEGFFVSLTCVCISGLVIAIQELPSVIPQKSGQTAVGLSMFLMTFGAIGALLLLYQTVRYTNTFYSV